MKIKEFKNLFWYGALILLGVLLSKNVSAQDITPPTIESVSPANNETGVAPDIGTLTLTLSESIVVNPDLYANYDVLRLRRINNTTFQSFEVDDPNQVGISGNVVTLKNVNTLEYGQTYYVQCNSSNQGMFEDAAGNGLADFTNNTTWRFTTRSSDLYIVSTYPDDDATLVDPRDVEDFTITFNQNVRTHPTLTWWLWIKNAAGENQLGFSTGSTTYMEIDGNTVTLKRRNIDLPYGEDLYFTIPSTAFRDDNNRYFEGIESNDQTTWNFSTKSDVIPPEIRSLSPANLEEGVDLDISTFNIEFNETVSLNTKSENNVVLYAKGKVENLPVAMTDVSGISSSKGLYLISFSGLEQLEEGFEYFIEIPSDMFYDSQNNNFEGTDESNWSFMANRRPNVISINNSSVEENLPAGTAVGTLSASDPDEGDEATVTLIGGTDFSSFQLVGTELRTTEAFDYESGTTKRITLRATDNAGATYDRSVTINIVDVDDTPPELETSDPVDGATGVDLSPTLTYTFNEDVALTDASTSTFYLRRTSNNQSVASWQAVGGVLPAGMSIVDNQIIFEVGTQLDHSTSYYFSAPAIADLAGNEASAFGTPSFTTRAASNENDILTFFIEDYQVGDAVIDPVNHTVEVNVEAYTPNLITRTGTVSPGATTSYFNTNGFTSGSPSNFIVRSELGVNQIWQVTITRLPFNGTYTVGPGGHYESLYYAFLYFASTGLDGDVVFELLDGYEASERTILNNPDPTYNVTIRPEAGATSINLNGGNTDNSILRIQSSLSNFTVDGADPSTGDVVMNINIDGTTALRGVYFLGSPNELDFEIKNVRFNIAAGEGIGSSSGTTLLSGLTVEGCEFVATNDETTDNIYGIVIQRSNTADIEIIGNKFYNQEGSPDPNYYSAIAASSSANVINNAISIRGATTFGISTSNNISHNTIHIYGSDNLENKSATAIYTGTTIRNNIINVERTSGTGSSHRGITLAGIGADDTHNNLFIYDDGVSNIEYAGNAETQADLLAIQSTTTFAVPSFTDESSADLSLTGASLSESDLRGIPIDGISEDIEGNSRSAVAPSKGAYEVPNRASDFLTFSIPEQVTDPVINTTNHTVTIAVNAGTVLTGLVPTFTISPGANIDKASGAEQNFTSPVSYTITDELEFFAQEWVVTVTEQNLAPTNIELDPASIDENQPAGTVVGELSGTDPNGDELVFAIVGGEGSQHGYLFEIDDETNELKSLAPFDHEQNEELYVRIEADDQQGETFEEAIVITVGDVDEISPILQSFVPEDTDTEVELGAEFVITYDENVVADPGSYQLRSSDTQLVETLSVSGGEVEISNNVVTLSPSSNLIYNTGYYIEALSGTVTDALGNPAPAIAAGSWTFTTENPVSMLSPANGADDVSPFANLELSFDRTVIKQTGGFFRLYRKSDDLQLGTTWSFNGAVQDGNTITYDIPINLEPGVEVYVEITNGIEDADGNPIDIVGPDAWSFTPVMLDQTVTLNPIESRSYGEGSFLFTAATSTSGQAITYSSSNESVATVDGNSITILSVGETTIRATQAGNTYYSSAFAEQVFTVNQASQSIEFEMEGLATYGDEPIPLSAEATSELDVTFDVISGNADIDDDNNLVITGTGDVVVRASQAGNTNVAAAESVDRELEIQKAVLTVTAENKSKTYGDANPAFTFEIEGFAYDETAAVLTSDPSGNTEAEDNSPVDEYDIVPSGATADNYTIEYVSGTLTINQKTLNVSPVDASREYGKPNPEFELAYDGFISGDDADAINTPPSVETSTTESSSVGEYDLTLSGGSDNNYTFEFGTGTLTINKATLIAIATSTIKAYGSENPDFDIEFEGFAEGDDEGDINEYPETSCESTATTDAGNYPITLSGGQADNYTFDYVSGTLFVGKASLSAAVQDEERAYGEANPTFTIVYDGFKAGDNANDLDEQPVATTDAEVESNVGEYDIILTEVEDANYEISRISGTLTVVQAAQIITIDPISDKLHTADDFTVEASTTSELPLTYDVSGPATHEGPEISLTGELGTVTVTVSQAGNLNYLTAEESITFEVVDLLSQTISFESTEDKVFGDAPFAVSASATSELAVSYSLVSGPATMDGNEVTITGAGSIVVAADQSGNEEYRAAAQETLTITVAKADQTITITEIADKVSTDAAFDVEASIDSGLELAYTVDGPASIDGNALTLSGSAGMVTVTVSQAGNDNYNEASAQTSFEVTVEDVLAIDDVQLIVQTYPNPATNYFMVEGQFTGQPMIRLFDTRGTLVLQKNLGILRKVSLNDVDKGLYILKISDDTHTTTSKLLIQR